MAFGDEVITGILWHAVIKWLPRPCVDAFCFPVGVYPRLARAVDGIYSKLDKGG
jgi:hypothetical protein